MKPLVKYVGGKTKLAPELGLLIPPFSGTYHEPFCGGAALFAHLYNVGRVKSAILSDLNKELIDLYREVQTKPDDFLSRMQEWESLYAGATAKDAEALFYRVRDDWNQGIRSTDRYVFLKQTSFNGLWRVSKAGRVNMPWGKYGHYGNRPPKFYDEANTRAWYRALQSTEVYCRDVGETSPKRGDVVYLDPPYVGTFDSYTAGGFSKESIVALLTSCQDWSDAGVFVMMSNSSAASVLAASCWPSSRRRVVKTTYAINRDATNRSGQEEVALWSSVRGNLGQSVMFTANRQVGLL